VLTLDASAAPAASARTPARPRLGFLGVVWIGRDRLRAIADLREVEVVAVADASDEACRDALAIAPEARALDSLDALLAADLDGLVIETQSALHAQQAVAALARGVAVFCQKPLARTAAENAGVVAAARRADRLLGVDLSYRETAAMQRIRALVGAGEIGDVYAVDLTFHNAYGPDKAWFRDPRLSGGGCVIDLGIHLVDLALWTLGFPEVRGVTSRLFAGGRPLAVSDVVEDHAVAQIELAGGAVVRLACSWNLAAGRDAVIDATFHGTRVGAAMRNVGGSFYEFVAERYDGTQTTTLVAPPDAWGGRAATAWARALARDGRFDPAIARVVDVARVLDAIYGR